MAQDSNPNHAKDDESLGFSSDFGASEMAELNQKLSELSVENIQLTEALTSVQGMVDERGWSPLYEHGHDGGLTLTQLKTASGQLRELKVGNPFLKRGFMVRSLYVWGGGCQITAKSTAGATTGLTAKIKTLVKTPSWQKYIMSSDAQIEGESAAYTDGFYAILGDNATKKVQRIQLAEITGDIRNPDNTEEVWAYRRQWYIDPTNSGSALKTAWYYTDLYEGARARFVNYGQQQETVDRSKTIIALDFNGQIGWGFGVPDSLSVIAWAKLYKDFLVQGYVMSRAMAQIAYQMTAKSAAAAQSASMAVARPGESGSTFIGGTELQALPTAGKGYEFSAGQPLLSAVAAGLDVSISELDDSATSDTQADFSAPGRGMAALRRRTWTGFYERLLAWAGESKDVVVIWKDLGDAQIQRALQAAVLAWNTGLFEGQVIQDIISDVMKLANPGALPDGVMLPNNVHSQDRLDIDTDGNASVGGAGGTKADPAAPAGSAGATAGTGQGQGGKKNSPAGSLGNDHTGDQPASK